MTNFEMALCVFGLFASVMIPRALPMTFLADRKMPLSFQRWLQFVPVSILAALVAPEIILRNKELFLSWNNVFLLASIPSILVAWKTKSLFITLATGMITVALLRFFGVG